MSKKKILITGAAGLVGGQLREFWGDRFALRLADIKPVSNLAPHEEFVEMNITQYDEFLAACEGVATVVHLAADRSQSAEFYKTLLDLNIIGCYNGFEAARAARCERIVFASSVNAILGYRYQQHTGFQLRVGVAPLINVVADKEGDYSNSKGLELLRPAPELSLGWAF